MQTFLETMHPYVYDAGLEFGDPRYCVRWDAPAPFDAENYATIVGGATEETAGWANLASISSFYNFEREVAYKVNDCTILGSSADGATGHYGAVVSPTHHAVGCFSDCPANSQAPDLLRCEYY